MSAIGGEAPLDEVEAAVAEALVRVSDEGLRILGYGEITLVVGWPAAEPAWACKRLPVFADDGAAARYREQFDRYLDLLADRGVTPVPSTLTTLPAATDGGGIAAYVVQPALPAGSLGPDVLRAASPDPDHPLLARVCAAVPEVVDPRTGLDGQISNWALVGDQLQYLDVTTPMLFDDGGRFELELDLFLAAYPWALRAPIRRFVAPGVVGAYRDARHVLLDLAANLIKERLEPWLPAAVEAANRVVTPAITVEEARAYYRSDARMWEVLLRLRRADRWWQAQVRHRPYPFLLPGRIER